MIEVRRIGDDPLDLEVVVREGGGETRHHVTMSQDTCNRLTVGKHRPEGCVEAAFRFLLDREPKESILGHFDVTMISRYFPKFDWEFPRYLSHRWRAYAALRDNSLDYAGLPGECALILPFSTISEP
jgi:hypothetical protein